MYTALRECQVLCIYFFALSATAGKTRVIGSNPKKQMPMIVYTVVSDWRGGGKWLNLLYLCTQKNFPPYSKPIRGKNRDMRAKDRKKEREWAATGSDMRLREYLTGIEKAREKKLAASKGMQHLNWETAWGRHTFAESLMRAFQDIDRGREAERE